MKKKIIIPIIIILVLLIVGGIILFARKYNYSDENTLYFVKFNDTILRFEHMDNVIPQNQIVAVQKSTNNGKTFETITEGQVIVSMEPKFVFLNEKLGFAVKKPNNIKDNNKYYGMYVTNDGGKTFNETEITYENFNIEVLTIEDVPFYENDKLKLHCSIYQVKSDQSGYETVDLYFITDDDGLTWHLENETQETPSGKVIAGTANTIQVEKNNLQDGNKFNKYLERDGKTIYIASNIKEIYYDDVKTKHVLKDYVQNTYQTIDDSIKHLTNYLSLFSELNDGGTRIYKSQEYDITIVKCNTIDGNKDYYIGDYNMNFDSNSMCK